MPPSEVFKPFFLESDRMLRSMGDLADAILYFLNRSGMVNDSSKVQNYWLIDYTDVSGHSSTLYLPISDDNPSSSVCIVSQPVTFPSILGGILYSIAFAMNMKCYWNGKILIINGAQIHLSYRNRR